MIKLTDLMNEGRSSESVKYGCLMAYIPDEQSDILNAYFRKLIPEKDLYKEGNEFGFEDDKHSTIKYGFKPDLTKDEIMEIIGDLKEFKIKLKSISQFKDDGKKGFDVVKFDVESDTMNKLNKEFSKFPNKDSYPDYHAHMTIAYVKPDAYKHEDKELDIEVPITELIYSPIEGDKIHIKLLPVDLKKKKTLNEGERLDLLNQEIQRLENEWDRLDAMGNRQHEQANISKLLQSYKREKQQWDSIYSAMVKESLFNSYDIELRNQSNYVEVFSNPSDREIKECVDHNEYALLLTDTDAYSWNRMKAYHGQIRAKDRKFQEALSLLVWLDPSIRECSVMATDNNKNTKWNENPNTEKFIRNHPFFRGKTIKEILYWNQDIVGDWSLLTENDTYPRTAGHDLIYGGIWSTGNIVAFKATETKHDHTPDMGRMRWIYDQSKKCVFWWKNPDNEQKIDVENYLHRIGYVVESHRDMNQYYEPIRNELDESMELITESTKLSVVESFLRTTIKGTEWENNVYAVGGYVRDLLMGNTPKDMDLVVEKPEGGILFANWLAHKFGIYKEGSNPVIASKYGTAKLRLDGVTFEGVDLTGEDIETVMTRSETYNDPNSRKPDVEYSDLKGDAERRDLTINALYKKISTGEIIDPTGHGVEDIKNHVIRTPLPVDVIYTDDALRMFRAIRFANRYGWELSPEVKDGIRKNLNRLGNTSKERIRDELNKILLSSDPANGVKMLRDVGLLPYVAPELQQAVGMTQNKHHDEDVFTHSLTVLSRTKPELINRLMGLFHDIGKVKTRQVIDNEVHFYSHENVGADVAERILTDLKYPAEIIKPVVLGIKNHMRLKQAGKEGEVATDKTLRKFVVDLGDHLNSILDLMAADNASHATGSQNPNQIPNIIKRISGLKNTIPAKGSKLPVTGNDLDTLKIPKGPIYKTILDAIRDAIYENPNLTRDEALEIVNKIVKK